MFYQVLTSCKWFNRSSTTSQSILPVICQNKLTLRDRQLLNNMPGMCHKDRMRLGAMRSWRTWSIMSRSSRWTAVSSPRRWSPRGTWPRTSPSCPASTVQKLDIKKTFAISHHPNCGQIFGAGTILQIIGDKVNIFHKRYTVLTKIFYSRCLTVINIIRRLSTSSSLMGEYSRDHKFVIFCLSNLLVRNIPNLLSRLYSFLVEGSTKFWVPYKLDDFLLFLHLVP